MSFEPIDQGVIHGDLVIVDEAVICRTIYIPTIQINRMKFVSMPVVEYCSPTQVRRFSAGSSDCFVERLNEGIPNLNTHFDICDGSIWIVH